MIYICDLYLYIVCDLYHKKSVWKIVYIFVIQGAAQESAWACASRGAPIASGHHSQLGQGVHSSSGP